MKFKYTILLACFISILNIELTAQSINDLHSEVNVLEHKLATLKKQNAALREIRVVEIQLSEKKKILEEKLALNKNMPDILLQKDLVDYYLDLRGKYSNPSVLRENLKESFKGKVVRLEGYIVTHFWKTIQQSWLQGSDWMQVAPQAFFIVTQESYGISKELLDKDSYCTYPCSMVGNVNLFFKLNSGITETDNRVIKYPFDNVLLKRPFSSGNCRSIECSAISYEAHKFNFYLSVKYAIEAEISNIRLESINGEWTEIHNYLYDALEFELNNAHFEVIEEK